MSDAIIAPSILSADFSRLSEEINEVKDTPWLHLDIMDGHFVPNLTIGPPVVASLRKVTTQFLDAHLMIDNPEEMIPAFADSGADQLSVHVEGNNHLQRLIQMIKGYGLKAGVVLNPHTPISSIEWVLEFVDNVLLMSVNPGFGGQEFITNCIKKIEACRKCIDSRQLNVRLQVDGGIHLGNIKAVYSAGADVFVIGSAIFNNPSPAEALKEFKQALDIK
jgi:ribulose-phosphate 3-epimerase